MKKIILSFLLAFVSFSQINASHIVGGEISWECLGNGDYIFTLSLYRDCNGASLSTTSLDIENNAGLGNIKCYFKSFEDVTESCNDPVQAITCNKAMNAPGGVYVGGAFSKYIYVSDTVDIDTVPPPAGFSFYYDMCCRPAGLQNITGQPNMFIESKLFATSSGGDCLSSSPRFLHNPPTYFTGKGSHSHLAATAGLNDSLYYRLVPVLSSPTSGVSFNSGFNYNAPLPDASENSGNGPNVFDQENGQLHYTVYGGTSGIYSYAVNVESWYNNRLISTVKRDITTYYKNNLPLNNPPNLNIDTAQFNNIIKNSDVYYINAFVGDTVNFEINSNDADNLPNGNPQSIKFESFSKILDSTMGTVSSVPQITPVSPQTSFTSAINNNVNFSWHIDPSMKSADYPVHTFLFRFTDDMCPYPGRTHIIVKINVQSVANIAGDTINVCEGDSIQLNGTTASGNYQWSPNLEISGVSLSQPQVAPTVSRFYYLSDPQNPGFMDSVFVNVENRGTLNLQHSNGIVYTGGSASINYNIWYYNHIPFMMNRDSINVVGPGDYFMQALGVICHYWSDTLNIQGLSNLVNIDPQNGNVAPQQMALDSSIGFNFELTQNMDGQIDTIHILGVSSGKLKMQSDSLTVKIYETVSQTEVFSFSQLLNNPMGNIISIPVGLQLNTQTQYTMALSGDTGIYIYTYENVNYPSLPYNGSLQVNGALKGDLLQYPSLPSNNLPAVVFNMERGFSLEDLHLGKMQLYPNPTTGRIFISGLEENENYNAEVVDIRGKLVKQMELDNSGIDIRSLAPGFYILQLQVNGKEIRYSFVKE